MSFLFLFSLFCLSGYLLYRYRNIASDTRLVSFGILWFFVTLSVESTFIPLRDVIFEHRMYLPSVGVFTALITAMFMLVNKYRVKAIAAVSALAVIVIVLTATTFARNMVWKDGENLWKDVISKSPNKARGHQNLGDAYYALDRTDEAIEEFQNAIKFDPDYARAYNNLGVAYHSQNLIDPNLTEAHCNLGAIYQSQGLIEGAIEEYIKALKLGPNFAELHNNLGGAYQSKGLIGKAIEHY